LITAFVRRTSAAVNEAELRPGNGEGVSPISDQTLSQNMKRALEN
jgi:hypothetical protein